MANTNKDEKVTMIDGTVLAVRPLKISLLKEFMKKFEAIAAVAEDNEKSMDLLLDCVQIAMKQYNPEIAGDRAALEENLDLPTVYKIVEEASGINMSAINTLVNQ